MKRLQQLKTLLVILAINQSVNADVGWARAIKKIKVAVIDTGIDESLLKGNSYCPEGHKDFTGVGMVDNHGHGTHISGIVDQYAKDFIFKPGKNFKDIDKLEIAYCQIIIKYYDPKQSYGDNLKQTIKSFKWAIEQNVDIINYSGGGTEYSKEENEVIQEALNKGIKVVAAAGNERSNIDKHKYYPAMYDKRIYVVGNLVTNNTELIPKKSVIEGKTTNLLELKRDIAASSNYGESINTWELGTSILSRLPRASYGYMTGTSQATAIKTGKLVREMLGNK